MLAQLTAVAIGGCVLSLVGAGLTVAAVAASLPTTDYGFLVSTDDVVRVIAASAFAGAAGAVLGAGIGAVVRNVGGAVTLHRVHIHRRAATHRATRQRHRIMDARQPRQRHLRHRRRHQPTRRTRGARRSGPSSPP